MLKRKKIVIAAGGTGGHLFPAQSVARELKELGVESFFLGGGLQSSRFFAREEFHHMSVAAAPLRGIQGGIKLILGIWQSLRQLKKNRPDLVLGFGSYHAFPVMAAALLLRIPLFLFESNLHPGKVNRLFARFARMSGVQFSQTATYLRGDTKVVQMPMAQPSNPLLTKEEARRFFSLQPDRQTILVFGGSQGAVSINDLICNVLAQWRDRPLQVIHLTGDGERVPSVEKFYRDLGIPACVKPFEKEMHYSWRAADVAICRSGAATLAELIAYEVPALLIPFPYAAEDHQRKNADFMEQVVKGAIHLRELDGLGAALESLLQADRLNSLRAAIASFKKNRANDRLSDVIHTALSI